MQDASKEAESNPGWMPLHEAARSRDAELVAVLLDKGSEVDALSDRGGTALHVAVRAGEEPGGAMKTVALLVRHGCNVNAQDENKWTPLHIAAYLSWYRAVRFLILQGADVNARASDGRYPVDLARIANPLNPSVVRAIQDP